MDFGAGFRKFVIGTLAVSSLLAGTSATAQAQASSKPNIVVIMGDDIGIWNIGAYSRGMMAGRTPNIDKLAKEGMLFTDYSRKRAVLQVERLSSRASFRFEPA